MMPIIAFANNNDNVGRSIINSINNYIRVERPYDPMLVNMVEDITI